MWDAFEKGGLIGVYKNYKKTKQSEGEDEQENEIESQDEEPTAGREKEKTSSNWEAFQHGGLIGLHRNLKKKKAQQQTQTEDSLEEESQPTATATPVRTKSPQVLPEQGQESGIQIGRAHV